MGYRAFFEGKRITVMGLGLLGRTVGDIEFMLAQGAKHVTVTDIRSAKILAPSVKRLKKYKKVHFVLGKHELKDFSARGGHAPDFILKAPSIPLASPYIREAEKSGIPMYMSTALFAQFARDKGAKIVGVTGTRGKSTVTHLLYHILKIAKRRVHLGGNIRGLSTLALLPKIKKGDLIVMELDSWQLQGFDALKISPSVSIFTSFSEDHLNYYPSMKRYFKDKAAIFLIIFISACVIFGVFWVELGGQGSANIARQLQSSGMFIPGFRRDERILKQILDRYIPTITILGSIFVALLAGVGDMVLGNIASGTGILLTVGIVYRMYEELAKDEFVKANPMLAKFFR